MVEISLVKIQVLDGVLASRTSLETTRRQKINSTTSTLHTMVRYDIIPGVWRGVEANPIVIYRQLIRQVGVLQDDVTRNFLKRHVRERFEDGRDDSKKRLTQHLREARHATTFLKKANLGYPKPLIKVMETGWGRRGKRRHELLTVGLLLSTAQLL